MPSPSKLAHVVLYTAQVRAMRDWYIKVLDAKVIYENDFAAFVTYDEEHHRIAVVDRNAAAKASEEIDGAKASDGLDHLISASAGDQSPPKEGAPNHGLSHVAFTYESLEKLLENYADLKQKGILPLFSINHGPTNSLYYADPDGNHIELQVDNFATIQEGASYMRSEAFNRNPIGLPIDPDAMLARLRRGDAAEAIIAPWW